VKIYIEVNVMFSDFKIDKKRPAYLQLKDYLREMILKGMFQEDERLPSTRELSVVIMVSRNTVNCAYEYLQDEGLIYVIKGKGAFVSHVNISKQNKWNIDWQQRVTEYARMAEELDIIKHEAPWKKGMISFKSIAPDEKLFDSQEFKRSFLNKFSVEGEKILNYGYAQGYKPLIQYLLDYMKNKGVDIKNKNILITNGFTEGFDITLSALAKEGDNVLCENPTHNTAIKIMKLHGLNIVGIKEEKDGMNIDELKCKLDQGVYKLAYIVPSYHNPTGIVMSPDKRVEVYDILKKYNIPILEDGFNEELRYSGAHVSPIASLSPDSNSVIYIGSFSKILFPGIRIGWIMADEKLIDYLESIKRSRNIHTSVLDQAILCDYLENGNFEKYIKKARKVYKEKYEFAVSCAKKFIPNKKILGSGGLHIFIELDGIDSRTVLKKCCERGVIFTPGDIFYTSPGGECTFRLGFSRVPMKDIEKGFKIIGEVVKEIGIN
jgi:DNA-binding transcriptional MocR family regulator